MITIIFIILLTLSLVYQLVLWFFLRIGSTIAPIAKKDSIQTIPVSIVICSFKSRDDLKLNLKSIMEQKYPEFEVIIVNDGIDQTTDQVLNDLSHSFTNLLQIKLEKTHPGKKQALNEGIKSAKHDWILLTDADCKPKSQFWIQKMVDQIAPQTMIVLGYSPYEIYPGLLNHFIRFEAVLNAILYFSMARLGFPYMAVGRNVLYHKSVFKYEDTHPEHISGDDDILINRKANSNNTAICLDPQSFVVTNAKNTWKEYFLQRRRHYSSSKYYSFKSQVFLFINSMSLMTLLLSSVCLIILGVYSIPLIVLLLFFAISGFIFYTNSKLLDPYQNILLYPLLNLIYLVFLILQAPLLLFQKKFW